MATQEQKMRVWVSLAGFGCVLDVTISCICRHSLVAMEADDDVREYMREKADKNITVLL